MRCGAYGVLPIDNALQLCFFVRIADAGYPFVNTSPTLCTHISLRYFDEEG